MDNLPKDPPNQNSNNNNPTPPPFGPNFNPHSNPSVSSNPPVQVIHEGGGGSDNKDDDNLAEFKLKNPFSRFFNWIMRLIKNEGINIKIKPLTAIAMVVALTGGGGIVGGIVGYAFPHSSPILHRAVIYQGNLQKTPSGFILTLPNSDLYTLRPKINTSINFQSLTNGPALVKGNLTPENFVIEVSEIIPLGAATQPTPATNSASQAIP